MQYSSLSLVAGLLAFSTNVFGNTTLPLDTCATITQTKGPPCPPVPNTVCTTQTCYAFVSVTASCGCPTDIATELQCETTCGPGCNTAYSTVYPPCPTPPPSSSSSAPYYGNTTVTVTDITTITTCPATDDCHGQTTIWTGDNGPFHCGHPRCTCVLPGGTQTVTVCPKSVKCTGQTTKWTSDKGPTSCPERVTCNWALPDVTVTSEVVVTPTKSTSGATKSPTSAGVQGSNTDRVHYEGGWAVAALLAVLGAIGML